MCVIYLLNFSWVWSRDVLFGIHVIDCMLDKFALTTHS